MHDAQIAAVFAQVPNGVATAPYITRAQLISGALVLSGTNGTPNGGFQVVGSADLALPANQWSTGASNTFDASGNFTVTNPVTPNNARRYYRLVSGAAPVAPSIFTPPQNQTVVVGQNATFNVTALGTAPLSYQWLFNSDFPIASATSSTLGLTNVQTDDAGQYSVMVTNSSGSVTSAPAILTVLVPPTITSQPTNQVVSQGQDATFTVGATGTAPLSYRWFFNTNTPLPNATNSTLTLANVQSTNAGSYFVIVTNRAGSITSVVATLTVNIIPTPPSITSQPTNQTVIAGQSATFHAGVNGTPPLTYQWFYNTTTPLPSGTAATLTLPNVQSNNAGGYSVIVTNNYGAATSQVAQLIVNPAPTNTAPDFGLYGFATYNFNLTGAGSNAPSVVVSNASQLDAYTDSNTNVIIYVSGTIPISGMSTHVRANKTVIGLGTNATLVGGGLYLYRSTNVILRNLTIRDSSEDDIGIHYSAHVWIDHCTIVNATDGGIDITQQSEDITISWCHFYYESNQGHDFVNLIAASDSDSGNYRVTFHHNWWATNCVERMPSVRFGRVHCYNNYYNAPGNDYCVRTRIDAQCLVENNHFENVNNPWEQYITSGTPGLLYATNNAFVNVTWTKQYPGTDSVFTPPYSYKLDPVALIPNMVTNYAGAGKGPFAP